MTLAKANTVDYIETPIKGSKVKNIKETAKNRAVSAMRELDTPQLVIEVVKRHWVQALAVAYVVEQSLHFARYLGVIG